MIKVLIVAGMVPPRTAVLVSALRQLRERGAQVRLACHFPLSRLPLEDGLAELRSLQAAAKGAGAAFRAAVSGAEPARQVWLHARRDPWVREHARTADVLVALDQRAVHTVWQLAQRHRGCDAVFGLTPAIKAVDARLNNPSRAGRKGALRTPSPRLLVSETRHLSRDTARLLARAATGRQAMRTGAARAIWRATVSTPGIPDRVRVKLAKRVEDSMIRVGHLASAAAAANGAARHLRDPRMRAELFKPIVDLDLKRGRLPAHLADAVTGELYDAEALYRGFPPTKAATPVAQAFDRLFHRALHFDSLMSPLAKDPQGFLAPLHNSMMARVLAGNQGRSEPAAPLPVDRPQRLLFPIGLNDNFLTPIRQRYESMPGIEVRYLDLSPGTPLRTFLNRGRERLIAHRLAGKSQYGDRALELFGPDLEWADTIFVDWCTVFAGMLSLVDPRSTRVIVRLHSYEAFSWWPHLVDFTRVDDVVFVSEHLRELSIAAIPGLRRPHGPRTHVVTNALDLQRYVRPKSPEARFNLGLVGIGAIAKDPRWAIEVLRTLRERDARYRLLLIGKDPDPTVSAAAQQYCERYERDLAELEPTGAIRRIGQTDDVPAALAEIGVILSSSVRESFHCALVEGAASGAVPVVRNWPFFAGKPHGAHTLFPREWVVETPQEAAKRILAATATEEVWNEERQAASQHALATWDWSVTQHEYDRLLLDPAAR